MNAIGTQLLCDPINSGLTQGRMVECGSFVRGRERKKGDTIPFILSRRDYMPRLPDEATR